MKDNNIINANYVSIWDGGTEIRTECKFDTKKNLAFDIESTDENIEDLDFLDKEYIELPSGETVETFTTEDGRKVVDGSVED
jgi:hypothetical protein